MKKIALLLFLITNFQAFAQFNDPSPFPQYASDHPVYKKAIYNKTLSQQDVFKTSQYILDTYAYPGQVPSRVGYALLSSKNPDKSLIYTRIGVGYSSLEQYQASTHYVASLIYGSALERKDALENYVFATLIDNAKDKVAMSLNSYRDFYKNDPELLSKINSDIAQIKILKQKFASIMSDANAIYNNYKDFPKSNVLSHIEGLNDLFYSKYKSGNIPKLSYPLLLFYVGKALTYHNVSSNLVDDTYIAVLAEKGLNSHAAFMLAERFAKNNNRKNNMQLVEVLDLVLAKRNELFVPQQIKLLSNKAMAVHELGDFTLLEATLDKIKPIISKVNNPVLRIKALVVLNITEMPFKTEKAKSYVREMQSLLNQNPYLKGEFRYVVEQYAYELGLIEARDEKDKDDSYYFNEANQFLKRMDYQGMIAPLEKAKAILDKKRATGNVEILKETTLLYNKVLTALVGAHLKTGQAELALEYAEMFKNKELNELLNGKDTSVKSVKNIQATLANDEALIYYINAGTYSNMGLFNFVVTKNKITGGFFDFTKFAAETFSGIPRHIQHVEKELALKEFRSATNTIRPQYSDSYVSKPGDSKILFEVFRSYLAPSKDDLNYQLNNGLTVFSNKMWGYLFPNVKYLEGITKLIISPAGDLSFIPFETFRNANTGRLFVEDYQISYIPSGSALVALRNQSKRSFVKNVLAFGDAKYSLRADKSFTTKSVSDVKRLQLKVQTSIKANENLDYAFASFQGKEPMQYLIGTKNEVEAIQQLVSKTDVRMNTDMTEYELKKLSSEGKLSDYKILHIASHASVHPYIFELSGMAMSVYATPQNGEDGIVTVDEMKALDMNPELVMLSACQTGLGRITSGETVQGLNNSLLLAGADATLTSLWSVDDYATSVFVKEFYDRVFNKNLGYKEAVTQIKREFLGGKYGERLRHPKYWAPFIYYGK